LHQRKAAKEEGTGADSKKAAAADGISYYLSTWLCLVVGLIHASNTQEKKAMVGY